MHKHLYQGAAAHIFLTGAHCSTLSRFVLLLRLSYLYHIYVLYLHCRITYLSLYFCHSVSLFPEKKTPLYVRDRNISTEGVFRNRVSQITRLLAKPSGMVWRTDLYMTESLSRYTLNTSESLFFSIDISVPLGN